MNPKELNAIENDILTILLTHEAESLKYGCSAEDAKSTFLFGGLTSIIRSTRHPLHKDRMKSKLKAYSDETARSKIKIALGSLESKGIIAVEMDDRNRYRRITLTI